MSSYREPRVESIELIDQKRLIFRGVVEYDFRNKRGAHTYLETYQIPYVGNPQYGWLRADGALVAPLAHVDLLDEASKLLYLREIFGKKMVSEKYEGKPVKKVLVERAKLTEEQKKKKDRREEIKKQRLKRMRNSNDRD